MSRLKVIALISQDANGKVERLAGRRQKGSLASQLESRDRNQYRLKTVRHGAQNQSKVMRLRTQESFDRQRNSELPGHNADVKVSFFEDRLEILTAWFDGNTLCELAKHRPSILKLSEAQFKERLETWGRAFEVLANWHASGCIHGNIKPENILVTENPKQVYGEKYKSEFFEGSDSIPGVTLLDGGYLPVMESAPKSIFNMERMQNIAKKEEGKGKLYSSFWQAPEVVGTIEGAYNFASDIYSLAAVMAWDLGFVCPMNHLSISHGGSDKIHFKDLKTSTVLGCLWPVFASWSESRIYIDGHSLERYSSVRIFQILRRIQELLSQVLEPYPGKRLADARQVVEKLAQLSRKLSQRQSVSRDTQIMSLLKYDVKSPLQSQEKLERISRNLLKESFQIPPVANRFFMSGYKIKNRLWYKTKSRTINSHFHLQRLTCHLKITGREVIYFRVRYTESQIPFSSLNRFVKMLLKHIHRYKPSAFYDIQSTFLSYSFMGKQITEVLPAFQEFLDKKNKHELGKLLDFAIKARHESLHCALEKLLKKLLQFSCLDTIIFDDIHRSDRSSLCVFKSLIFANSTEGVVWVAGLREEDRMFHDMWNELAENAFSEHVVNISQQREPEAWSQTLDSLPSDMARLLGVFAVSPLPMCLDIIDFISYKTKDVPGLWHSDIHHGKNSVALNKWETAGRKHWAKQSYKMKENSLESLYNTEFLDSKGLPELLIKTLEFASLHGIISEERDPCSGRLVCYHWVSERISLSLSLLLSHQLKKEVAFRLTHYFGDKKTEAFSWSQLLYVAKLFSSADTSKCGHAAFSALMQVSENVCDIASVRYLIKEFQSLEEKLERDKSTDADSLIPRIREQIGDLARALGDTEIAHKYYQAVSWNMEDPKRKSILSLKSFFPGKRQTPLEREEQFREIIRECQHSGLIPRNMVVWHENPIRVIKDQIKALKNIISSEESLRGFGLDSQPLNSLVLFQLENPDGSREKLPYSPRTRAIREHTFAQFLRSALGWLPRSLLFPQSILSLHMAIMRCDGATIAHSLFSLLVCGERSLPKALRVKILECISDVSAKTGNELALAESILYKAWASYFYDGLIEESLRSVESLMGLAKDLPETIKRCSNRLLFILRVEKEFKYNGDEEGLGAVWLKEQFAALDLEDWDLGKELFLPDKSHNLSLIHLAEDVHLISDILSEKTDLILLYSMLSIERGYIDPLRAVNEIVRETGAHEWFLDENSHLEYVPNSVAVNLQRTFTDEQSNAADLEKEHRAEQPHYDFFHVEEALERATRWRRRRVMPAINWHENWGEDVSIACGVKFGRAANPDPEKLSQLAIACAQSGLYWQTFRLAKRAGSDFYKLRDEAKHSLNRVAGRRSDLPQDKKEKKRKEAKVTEVIRGGSQEQAVILNYLLEYIHNLRGELIHKDRQELEEMITLLESAIPEAHNAEEAPLQRALDATILRLKNQLYQGKCSKTYPNEMGYTKKAG